MGLNNVYGEGRGKNKYDKRNADGLNYPGKVFLFMHKLLHTPFPKNLGKTLRCTKDIPIRIEEAYRKYATSELA